MCPELPANKPATGMKSIDTEMMTSAQDNTLANHTKRYMFLQLLHVII